MAKHLKNNPEKWIYPSRILCMDHGSKTLGLAISDSNQTMVMPMETIHRTKWKLDKPKLTKIFEDYGIKIVVVGYPLNMDGTKGTRCQSTKDFVTLMEETWSDIEFLFFDERLSTDAVDVLLDENRRMTRSKRKAFKDSLAAQLILEEALHFLKNNA